LSPGSEINSGADDAAGLSRVNGLAANSAALTQSTTNATEGVGLLQVADGALSQITSLLDRAVTLATEASNGTLNSTQEAAANQEYQSILPEINNIGSTTTYNQNQVFTCSTPGVSIYTGDSSSTGASIDVLYFAKLTSAASPFLTRSSKNSHSEPAKRARHCTTCRCGQAQSFGLQHEADAQLLQFLQSNPQIGQRSFPAIQQPYQHDTNFPAPRSF
jgi:flagellin-like hook-associated protein FlgL